MRTCRERGLPGLRWRRSQPGLPADSCQPAQAFSVRTGASCPHCANQRKLSVIQQAQTWFSVRTGASCTIQPCRLALALSRSLALSLAPLVALALAHARSPALSNLLSKIEMNRPHVVQHRCDPHVILVQNRATASVPAELWSYAKGTTTREEGYGDTRRRIAY